MPLTGPQKVSIRSYLGYSARFHQMDSALEQAFSAVDNDSDSLSYIQRTLTDPAGPGLLASIADIDTKLVAADKTLLVDAAGSVKLDAARQVGLLRSKGRMFISRLSALLGVRTREDYFAGQAARGPFFGMGGSGGDVGGGNIPRVG
jgi:hypothetical protein